MFIEDLLNAKICTISFIAQTKNESRLVLSSFKDI